MNAEQEWAVVLLGSWSTELERYSELWSFQDELAFANYDVQVTGVA